MPKRAKRFVAQFSNRRTARFVCEGSMAKPHESLYFTPAQANKGCPHGCQVLMTNKDHGRAVK